MNNIILAVDNIKRRIPREVLDQAFKDELCQVRRTPVSLDEQIIGKLIRPRVLIDCNLIGGQTILLSLAGINFEQIDAYSVVYTIPSELIHHREIISVLEVGYQPMVGNTLSQATAGSGFGYGVAVAGLNSGGCGCDTAINTVAQRLLSSYGKIPITGTATVDLVGYNSVVIRDMNRIMGHYALRAVVSNDDNLTNINPRSMQAFFKMCELAAKSYVYNALVVRIDRGYLVGGQELGAFKTIVDNYQDAESQYQDYLRNTMAKVLYMNDSTEYSRFIRHQISPGV